MYIFKTMVYGGIDMDEKFMDIAIEISKNAKYPYGAIIVKDGEIIGRSDDDTLMSKTMYTHAELMAIESACKEHPKVQRCMCLVNHV